MFARTEHGLSNEHLFYGVELIVYCEGEAKSGDTSSLDELFWTRIFACNGKSVSCKSIGDKPHLVELAGKIVSGAVKNVIVAMDRDYDLLRGVGITHCRVVYTYGYSWENDVISQFDFALALSAFVTIADTSSLQAEFDTYIADQSQALRRPFALDFKYIGHGESLFERRKPLSIIELNGKSAPCLKKGILLSNAIRLGKFQTGPLPRGVYSAASGLRYFYGKTVARLVYHWFVYRTKNMLGKRSIPYDAFMSLITSQVCIGRGATDIDRYYSAVIGAVI